MRLNESYQSTVKVTSSTMSILTIPFGHDNDSLMNFSQTKNTYFLHSNVAFSALLYCKFDSDEHSYCDNRLTEAD